jgi:hypothetical protein
MRTLGLGVALPVIAMVVAAAMPAGAQEGGADAAAELAKKLANPVASLISVPLQFNHDVKFGADDNGSKSVLNIQPVWPFSLGQKWNLITRTIIPVVSQQDIPTGTDKSGLGDIQQSFFFSPKATVGGWVLAAGAVFLYPTASDELLGGGKWGVGPTALALKQAKGWTVGLLTNHISSFAGDEQRADISTTFIQPFLSYVTRSKTTLGLNAESTYDWEGEQWMVPLNLTVAQLVKVGKLPASVVIGARYWANVPEGGPEDLCYRAGITFLFPK